MLPMYNTHPYFSLKNWGGEESVHYTRRNMGISKPPIAHCPLPHTLPNIPFYLGNGFCIYIFLT